MLMQYQHFHLLCRPQPYILHFPNLLQQNPSSVDSQSANTAIWNNGHLDVRKDLQGGNIRQLALLDDTVSLAALDISR